MCRKNTYSFLEYEHAFCVYIDLHSISMTDQLYFRDVHDSNEHAYHDCKNSLGTFEYAQLLEVEFRTY